MKSTLLACVTSLLVGASALADRYPPGPDSCCPDTLTIINIQNPVASPHLGSGDVVLGVGRVLTGFFGLSPPYGTKKNCIKKT